MNGTRTRTQHEVALAGDISPGERRIVSINGVSIGVFNVRGTFVAALNVCPHEAAPVCRGHVRGTNVASAPGEFQWARDGEILACPWHGWEFDLASGACLTDPKRPLRLFPVEVRDGKVFVAV